MRERDHGPYQGHGIGIVQHRDNERAIDLERLDRQPRQVGERGVPGTEVVDRDVYAEPAHRIQLLDIALDVLHDQALGDLQIDAGRRYAVDDRAFHHADEVALPQLDRRNVYRDPGWLEFLLDPAAVIERSAPEGP